MLRKDTTIPVGFHNSQNYDFHLFVKSLGRINGHIQTIAKNSEKYISVEKAVCVGEYKVLDKDGKPVPDKNGKPTIRRYNWYLRFVDTCRFLKGKLEDLVKNLPKEEFKLLREGIGDYTEGRNEKFDLVLRKGVFPYEWFDDIEKLDETKLPRIEEFYSSLTGESISEEDYEHAKKVWRVFGFKTMRDYLDFYCMVDTLQLTDIMEYQRDRLMKTHGLDIAHSYTLPGFSWKAALKYTKQELELLHDREKYDFVQEAKREGISTITHWYAKANNPHMKSKYLRGESLMSIVNSFWTMERIYEKYSEKTAKEITKYYRKSLGKKWKVSVKNDEIKDLEMKMKDGDYVLTIEEAVKVATFADACSARKGMAEIKKRIKDEQQYSTDDVCELASKFFSGFNAKEIKAFKEGMRKGETFNPEQTSHILRCKQFVWIGNVSTSSRWKI